MKVLVAVCVFSLILAISAKEIDTSLEEKCLKEIGMDHATFKAALEKKADEADQAIKCISKCMLKEKKMINEDGAFDVQQIAASLFTEPENVEVAKPFIESCLKSDNSDDTTTAAPARMRRHLFKREDSEAGKTDEGAPRLMVDPPQIMIEPPKREPSCGEAYDMIICVTRKIEEALKEDDDED